MTKHEHKSAVRIRLTPEQAEQVKRITGKNFSAVKLRLDVLEERVAPSLSSN